MIPITEEIAAEAHRKDCFLCRPNAALLAHVGHVGYTVAGLGPLSDAYAVLATHNHIRGLEAADSVLRETYAAYAAAVGSKLADTYGSCLVVEHGNMAVCGVSEEGRAHCFHPHFLLIPSARSDVRPFVDYFGSPHEEFASIREAIEYGAGRGQYVLVGDANGPFHVFLPDGELPRQFARGLVADQLGVLERASWRDCPDLPWTVSNASLLRRMLAP